MGDSLHEIKREQPGIPKVCQYEKLFSPEEKAIQNENVTWITETSSKLPLWSRLCIGNCLGQGKRLPFGKMKNFEVEIPGRLLSLFGNTVQQTRYLNRMDNMKNFHSFCSVLALCASLSNNFDDWSKSLLDTITMSAANQYPEFLKKLHVGEKEISISHLNSQYILSGKEFSVQLQQVTAGYLYHRFGMRELNLARALTWFVKHYQFGMIQCGQRTLVFGHTLDVDYGFFLYDCQSRGFPIFEDERAASYILRTHHLQILLYCIIVTLNETHVMTKFTIYSADVRILNYLESRPLKKEKYIPTIVSPKKKIAANTNTNNPQIPMKPDMRHRLFARNPDWVPKRKTIKPTKVDGKNNDSASAFKRSENKVDVFISSIPYTTKKATAIIRQNSVPTLLYPRKELIIDNNNSGIIFNSSNNTTAINLSDSSHSAKQLINPGTLSKKPKKASSTTKLKRLKKSPDLNEPTTATKRKKLNGNKTASATTLKRTVKKTTATTSPKHWKG